MLLLLSSFEPIRNVSTRHNEGVSWAYREPVPQAINQSLTVAKYAGSIGSAKGTGTHAQHPSTLRSPGSPFFLQAAQPHRGILLRAYATAWHTGHRYTRGRLSALDSCLDANPCCPSAIRTWAFSPACASNALHSSPCGRALAPYRWNTTRCADSCHITRRTSDGCILSVEAPTRMTRLAGYVLAIRRVIR